MQRLSRLVVAASVAALISLAGGRRAGPERAEYRDRNNDGSAVHHRGGDGAGDG